MSSTKGSRPLEVKLFSVRPAEPPFDGSVSVSNHLLMRVLRSLGHSVDYFHGIGEDSLHTCIPLEQAVLARHLVERSAGHRQLYIFDDPVIGEFGPMPELAPRAVLLLHGLLFNFHQLFQMPCYAQVWTASEYLKDVYVSTLRFLSMARPRRGAPQLEPGVESIRMPLPCLEYANGYPSPGAKLPAALGRGLDSADMFGVMLRPRKCDPEATAAIVFHLNELLRGRKSRQTGYLILAEQDYGTVVAAARTLGIAEGVEPFLIPLPLLRNTELMRLFRRCAFSLCYDRIPDSFGFYPLESVFCGCPVYSNGCGNLRNLLPPGHGIEVNETLPMVFGSKKAKVAACRGVASRILSNRESGIDQVRTGAGRQYIEATFSLEQARGSLQRALAKLDRRRGNKRELVDGRSCTLRLNPLVRSIDLEAGLVISDYRSTRLTSTERDFLLDLDNGGRRQSLDAFARNKAALRTIVDLCAKGILACHPEGKSVLPAENAKRSSARSIRR